MRLLKVFIITVLLTPFLWSCSTDEETGYENNTFYAAYTFLHRSVTNDIFFVTDDGISLYPLQGMSIDTALDLKRIYIEFYVNQSNQQLTEVAYTINLVSYQEVGMQGIDSLQTPSSELLEHSVNSIQAELSSRFINLNLKSNYSKSENSAYQLVDRDYLSRAATDNIVDLYLHCDLTNDATMPSNTAYISFDVKNYLVNNPKVIFQLHLNNGNRPEQIITITSTEN